MELHSGHVQPAGRNCCFPAGGCLSIANLHIRPRSVTFTNPLFISIIAAQMLQRIYRGHDDFGSSVAEQEDKKKKKGRKQPGRSFSVSYCLCCRPVAGALRGECG
jgi:hypothetical protein